MSSPPPGNSTAPTSPPSTPSAPPPANNTTSPPPTTPVASPPPPTATPTPPVASPPPTATPSPPPPKTPVTPASSPPPPTTPATSPPPPANATTPASPPVVPVTSPPPPTTPVTPAASPPPPITPATSPPPPATPVTPAASPPPPITPATSPPAPTTPIAPVASPPPPATPGNSSPPSTLASPPPPSRSSAPPPPLTTVLLSPPPVTRISPPTTGNLTPPPSETSSNSTGLIAGLAIGGVFALVLLGVLFICCRKRRRDQGPAHYYGPPPPGSKDGSYAGPPQYWQHNAPPPADHLVTVLSKPSPPSGVASRLPFSSSSGGSESNYSGSENPLLAPSAGMALGFSKSTFTYEELVMATDGFSDANLLGQGGFGYVHRGVLPNGKEVAIKQLKAGSGQGEREFQAEVEIISRVHHKHLVTLVGYCITGAQRLLVYEFVSNGTLEFHLHGKGRPTMDWASRLKIALGSAKGLAYLHEDCHPKIIHRDIKAANILLDFKFEAKVADFGLAKFSSDTNSHVSTRVMGTFGYLAPEYASSGKLTEKSDVFSFGVMLLELITGRQPFNVTQAYMDDSLVEWARPLLTRALEDGNFDTLVDPRLQKDYNPNEMACMVACAAACVRHSARRRPRMSQTVRALEGDVSLDDLNEGIRPGHSTVYSAYGSSDYDTNQYNEDMKKFRKTALASQEYSSSEYSRPTSEYGLYPSGSSSEGQQNTREMKMGK